jgi:hypothetical protein
MVITYEQRQAFEDTYGASKTVALLPLQKVTERNDYEIWR